MCPIRLLLILALRTGQTVAASIDEVLITAASRRDRTIHWRNGKGPVLGCLRQEARIHHERPGLVNQVNKTLLIAGRLVGISARLRPHDLLRGATRDLMKVQDRLKGGPNEAAAARIGHSRKDLFRGKTDKLAGGLCEQENWCMRAKENFLDEFCPLFAGLQPSNGNLSRAEPKTRDGRDLGKFG
jgi:hypothetical protein